MRSVADEARARTHARVAALSPRERVGLALALGDDDLALFLRSSGVPGADALRRLRALRARDRRPSVASSGA